MNNRSLHILLYGALCCALLFGCEEQKEHTAAAINDRDSVARMTSFGINTLVSDSGVMKYRIVAEQWEINEVKNPPRWLFRRGLFLEQFDEKFHVESYIQADTAYYFNVRQLWHLIGNVRVKTTDGLIFTSEELYWDQQRHELYSNVFSRLVTPERELQGAYFTSDEHMRHYKVTNTKGSFTQEDTEKNEQSAQPAANSGDGTTPAVEQEKRAPANPRRH